MNGTNGFLPALRGLTIRLLDATPKPPGLRLLASRRRKIAEDLLEEHFAEIQAVQKAYAPKRKKAGRSSNPEVSALSDLADSMVGGLRARLLSEATGPLAAHLAWLDALLPTKELEYMDQPARRSGPRLQIMQSVDDWSHRFGSYGRFVNLVAPLLQQEATSLLDLGSGACGFPIALAEAMPSQNHVTITASDVSAEFLELGRARCEERGIKSVAFRNLDVATLGQLDEDSFDVVTCVQSLHHLGAGGATVLMAEAVRIARRGVMFVDLARSVSGFVAFTAVSVLAHLDQAFRHDALLSMRKAFVPEELELMVACVPGGQQLEVGYEAPGFVYVRTRSG